MNQEILFLSPFEINKESSPSELVKQDYRTADVFNKYGIEYCCGGRWPIHMVCATKNISLDILLKDLAKVTRTLQLSTSLPFHDWSIDFLTGYLVNVHHSYLRHALPVLAETLHHFAEEHADKYPYYRAISLHLHELKEEMLAHLKQEEEVIFPYARQVARAHEGKESFGALLVRTLRKPVAVIMDHDHEILVKTIYKFRELTDNYTPPQQACPTHHVVLSRLKELDNDLVQHIHLENEILFPRVISMEKELLEVKE
ncbi:MAG: DUF542 domain-containing protein [Chitinophagaceae bacterium]